MSIKLANNFSDKVKGYQQSLKMRNKSLLQGKENMGYRMSLKCPQSSRNKIQSGRHSIPSKIKRESLPIRKSFEPTTFPSRQSLMQNRPIRKEAIIQNLIKKLDREQDLRLIIEVKLKNLSDNKSIYTLSNQSNENRLLRSKLKNCEQQLGLMKYSTGCLSDSNYSVYQEINQIMLSKRNRKQRQSFHRNDLKQSLPLENECSNQCRQSIRNLQFFQNIDKTISILNGHSKYP